MRSATVFFFTAILRAVFLVSAIAIPVPVRAQPTDTVDTTQLAGRGVEFESTGTGGAIISTLVSLGDVNGDGLDDIGIHAGEHDLPAPLPYTLYMVYGRPDTASHHLLGTGLVGATIIVTGLRDAYISALGDLDGDGLSEFALAHEEAVAGVPGDPSRGVVSVIRGSRDFPEGRVSLAEILEGFAMRHFVSSDETHTSVGRKVKPIGDVNGDGREDLAILTSYTADGPVDEDLSGIVFVLFDAGGPESVIDLAATGESVAGFQIRFVGGFPRILGDVAPAGDVNGDGLDDLFLSGSDGEFLVQGRMEEPGGLSIRRSFESDDFTSLGVTVFYSPHPGVRLDVSIGIGDLDGDGFGDFAIGEGTASLVGVPDSRVYLIYGREELPPSARLEETSEIRATVIHAAPGARRGNFGTVVAPAGDINGDGVADLLIGAMSVAVGGRASAGEVILLYGRRDWSAEVDLGEPYDGIRVTGPAARAKLGQLVSGGGDFNGDGGLDFLVAAPDRRDGPGYAYVIYGTGTGPAPLTLLAVEPLGGPVRGGTEVVLRGSGFEDGMEVRFGDRLAAGVRLITSSEARASTPPGISAGPVEVSVQIGAERRVAPEPFEYGRNLPDFDLADPGSRGLRIDGTSGFELGQSLAFADLDGDGIDELAIGSALETDWVVSIVIGGRELPVSLRGLETSAHVTLVRRTMERYRGHAEVGAVGDLNGDGVEDLAMGARDGVGFVFFGRADLSAGEVLDIDLEVDLERAVRFLPDQSRPGHLYFSRLGDVTGDGIDDLIVAAGGPSDGLWRSLITIAGTRDWPDEIEWLDVSVLRIDSPWEDFGSDLVNAGDVDGDGIADFLLIGLSELGDVRFYLLYGDSLAGEGVYEIDDFAQETGAVRLDRLGRARTTSGARIGALGDINADGFADFAVADESAVAVNHGITFVIHGGPDLEPVIELREEEDPDAPDGILRIEGAGDYAQSGRAVGPAGDFDGDGYDDFRVGSHTADVFAPGNLSIIFGGPELPRRLSLARLGRHGVRLDGIHRSTPLEPSTPEVGDLNGDGAADFAFTEWGSPFAVVPDGGPPPAGGVHVLFGLPRDIAFVRGDANSDGEVNIADSVFLLTFLFAGGEAPRCRDAADFDDDGSLTITDPVYLLAALFGSGAPLAPPHPDEGPDPTDDTLDCRGF